MNPRHLTWYLALLIIIIFLTNAVADYFHLYYHLWWFDIPMHVIGGFWVAFFGLVSYFHSPLVPRKDHSAVFVITYALALTMCIGLFWEVFEFSVDNLITFSDNDLADTLGDLINDLLGALVAIMIFLTKGYNKSRTI